MSELIFIEGVSGVGKSTMIRMLSEKLNEQGRRTRAYLEFDFTNPIDFYCTAYLTSEEYRNLCKTFPGELDALRRHTIPAGDVWLVRYFDDDTPLFVPTLLAELRKKEFCYHPAHLVSLEEYTTAYRHVWENFAADIDDTYDYILFDGSLLHHPINDMMRNYHITGEQAVLHVTTLLRALGARKRRIFYLETDDIGAQLTRAHIDRGQNPPSAEDIRFWQTRHRNDRIVLKQIHEESRIFDISGGTWDSAREQIEHLLIHR
ncbi:MAG: hypothetical protein IJ334_07030 [Clostridia bacterium]|nr:hypothetical protein [Clostridia bacterium]